MYNFISAMSKSLGVDRAWESIDISDTPLYLLFLKHSRVIVTLNNVFLPTNVAVDLLSSMPQLAGLDMSLNEFLVQNGNKTLPAMSKLPDFTPQFAKYADCTKAGYSVTPCNPNTSVSANQPSSRKPWLYLTKDKVDYQLFYKSCLVNVNGLFHLTDTDGTGIYVVDGMRSVRKSNLNHVGLYSFADIGSIQLLPITNQMIYKQTNKQDFKNHVFINTGINCRQKTVMLVLGGYLHELDDVVFKAINDSVFKIDFSNLPFLDRYYESEKYLDLSSMGLSSTIRNRNQLSIDELYGDASIAAYLKLSQTFLVIIDNDDVSVNRSAVRKTPCPDMFIGYERPIFPLVAQTGKVVNYWDTEEDGEWSLTCCDGGHVNPLYDTVDVLKTNSVDSALLTTNPVKSSNAYFLKISSVNV